MYYQMSIKLFYFDLCFLPCLCAEQSDCYDQHSHADVGTLLNITPYGCLATPHVTNHSPTPPSPISVVIYSLEVTTFWILPSEVVMSSLIVLRC